MVIGLISPIISTNLLNLKIMDKLNKIYEEWKKLNNELFQESKDYIKKCLSTIDNSISLDECNICVTYDGGNHPEYYANPFFSRRACVLRERQEPFTLSITFFRQPSYGFPKKIFLISCLFHFYKRHLDST